MKEIKFSYQQDKVGYLSIIVTTHNDTACLLVNRIAILKKVTVFNQIAKVKSIVPVTIRQIKHLVASNNGVSSVVI